jgi:hypothetical protein
MSDTGGIQLDLGRAAQWVINANLLDEAPIAWAALVGSDDAIKWCLFAASACETESYGHTGNPGNKSRQILQMSQGCVKVARFACIKWFL